MCYVWVLLLFYMYNKLMTWLYVLRKKALIICISVEPSEILLCLTSQRKYFASHIIHLYEIKNQLTKVTINASFVVPLNLSFYFNKATHLHPMTKLKPDIFLAGKAWIIKRHVLDIMHLIFIQDQPSSICSVGSPLCSASLIILKLWGYREEFKKGVVSTSRHFFTQQIKKKY